MTAAYGKHDIERLQELNAELLAELKRIKADLDDSYIGTGSRRSREETRAAVRAAIQKAEGKS